VVATVVMCAARSCVLFPEILVRLVHAANVPDPDVMVRYVIFAADVLKPDAVMVRVHVPMSARHRAARECLVPVVAANAQCAVIADVALIRAAMV